MSNPLKNSFMCLMVIGSILLIATLTVIFAKPYFSNKKDNIKPSTEVAIEDESYGEEEPPEIEEPPTTIAARDTVAQINHINWIVSKIKTYNNVLVLEQEYKQISPDRLNLNRIPNQKTLNTIMAILDLLHSMMRAERELEFWRQNYEVRCKNAQFEFWTGQYRSTGSLVSGIPWTECLLRFDPVFSLTTSALDSYRNYSQYLQNLEDEALQTKFNFKEEQIERLHQLNKELLQTQWDMIQEYNLDDSLRVADSDIIRLIDALKDSDRSRVYFRIEAMKERFKIFPVYWYYLSSVALSEGHTAEALAACNTFFEVNRGLFREDTMAAAVAMNKVYLLEKTEENKETIKALLEIIWKHNVGDVDWRKDYFIASIYNSYLGDKAMAEKVIMHTIAALESSLNTLLKRINESNEKEQIHTEELEFTDGSSLWLCRRLLDDIKQGEIVYNENGLRQICQNEMTSNIEKLNYVGKMKAPKFWETVGDEIKTIKIEIKEPLLRSKKSQTTCYASIPVRWFLSGRLSVDLELLKGDNVLHTISESRVDRKIGESNRILLQFNAPSDKWDGVNGVRLIFQHVDCPLQLFFVSASPYYSDTVADVAGLVMRNPNFMDNNVFNDLRLMEIHFKNLVYRLDLNNNTYKQNIRIQDWESAFKTKFPNLQTFKPGIYTINKGGCKSIECTADGKVKIYYENATSEKMRPAVSIYFLNQYGVITKRIDDVWKIKRLQPNSTAESEWFSGDVSSTYIDIEVAE